MDYEFVCELFVQADYLLFASILRPDGALNEHHELDEFGTHSATNR